ncbi:tRNA 2-thiouridine(34) synthase MnmA [Acidiferrobacter sp. SPIII_3]|uniref:tRNA 2-thiouridine(34) synthase MnmA n=1 Tax=Acidiferrobacter sp. SPIII_3 TaxID=1281578 RepID=UPI000D725400|nr:tRNA 2-thiouridine(34) synthase MnmA [Acidiferrobacter sp. SPIII_3]AWP23329.1 tRNA 2-thiouridine(34) synthase MnmA [Acidiferrobacter sp. SPIII_3]
MKGHVVVALSGGVDSAVAAALLLEQGYRVTGLFMKNWEDDDRDGFCPSAEDYQSARDAALHLEIPLHAANFAQAYRDRVFARFLADCKAGLTPNPDILCNREIKFDVFWRHARGLGAEFMATGHYARVARCDGRLRLLAGRDPDKDQSYFLHTIDPAILPFVRFPIGDFTKAEVRARARALGLANAERQGSSGICFIGERRFAPFLRRYLKAVPGPIYTVDGEPKGSHEGLLFYTIGQRQGLGVGGPGAAWYVADKRLTDNALIIAQGDDHPSLYRSSCRTAPGQWLGPPPTLPWRGLTKIRYRQSLQEVCVDAGGSAPEGLTLTFARPQRAVTPGQSAVFYDTRGVCLGGAVIVHAPGPKDLAHPFSQHG